MSDDAKVVIRSGKTIQIGTETWVIADEGGPVHFVDWLTECRHFGGNVYLSFASAVADAGNEPEARICARLRMNLGAAQNLHKMLGDMIADATKPIDKTQVN